MAIGPHELLSLHSCSDQHLQGIRASTTVGGFSRNISVLPSRGRLSQQAPHLRRSFMEPHPSMQEGKTGSPSPTTTVKPACHSVMCTWLAFVMYWETARGTALSRECKDVQVAGLFLLLGGLPVTLPTPCFIFIMVVITTRNYPTW